MSSFATKVQPIVGSVVQNLEIISERFYFLVPGVSGFSWDLSFVPLYSWVLIVNTIGRILVRGKV